MGLIGLHHTRWDLFSCTHRPTGILSSMEDPMDLQRLFHHLASGPFSTKALNIQLIRESLSCASIVVHIVVVLVSKNIPQGYCLSL